VRRIYFSVIVAIFALSFGLALRAQLPHQVDTWALRGTSPDNRVGAAAVALSDGRTLIAGGTIDGTATDTVVLYNPADGSFSSAGQLLAARAGHTATLLEDGRVLVAGGTVNSVLSGDLEVFDPAAGASTLVATMAELRSGHAAARLSDGTVLIAGGTGTAGVLKTAEVFDPNTGTSSMVSTMQSARTGASATTLIDGRVLIAGGNDGNADLATAEIFYALTQAFEPTDTTLSVPRQGHAAVLLPNNGSVLIAGGSSNGEPKASADVFLPAQFPDPYSYGMGRFASTAAMATPRVGAVGAAGLEGYALAIGGGSSDTEAYRFATIKTDKDDYAPGTKAIISGSGWQAGERVTLLFQEDPAVHDDYVLNLTADAEGRIYHDQWAPEEHDLGVRFYLMASGQQSQRRAQTTFTDNRNVRLTNPTLTWYRTGALPGGFDVPVSGTYTCNTQGGNDCNAVTNLTITVTGVTGSKVVTGLTSPATNTSWGPVPLEFRTSWGPGQFEIPADGRYEVVATLSTSFNGTANPAESDKVPNYFGVDNKNPVTTIFCNGNGVTCVNPYNADVAVTLSADDGPGSTSSGIATHHYCIDETNSCEPGTLYTSGFNVVFASGVTKYIRYRSTDVAGNVETTKSQHIQFQANTFDVRFNATAIDDVPGGTAVLSVTIDGGPAVTVTKAELPKTFADLPSGTDVSYSYNSPLAVSTIRQYRWLSAAGSGSVAGPIDQSGAFTVSADTIVSSMYKAQHLLTFNLSGVDPDYAGTVVNIDGSPIASTSFVGNSYTQWIDNLAPAPVVTWTDPLPSSDPGKRYDFLNASPAAFTSPVSEPQTMTATYQKQWLLTFNLAGVDGDYTGPVVTIDGSPIASAAFLSNSNSYSQWVNDGGTPVITWQDPLTSTVTGKRYDFVATTPAFVSPVTIAQTLSATYQKQWRLTFNLSGVAADYTATVVTVNGSAVADTSFSSNSYTLWVNHNSPLTVAWADPLASTVTGKQYALVSATTPSTPVTVAQTLTAIYKTQWLLTFNLAGVDADYTGTVVTIGGVGVLSAPFLSNANSYSQWVDAGPAPTVVWSPLLASGVTGKRYAFVSATALTSPIATPQTITATYQKQWQLTWTQTGVAGTGLNPVVIVNGSPKLLASPLFSDWFNDGASVSYAFQTPISTDPPSGTQFELTNGGTLPASPFNVSSAMTINGDYSANVYTIQYLSPLDQSEGTSFRLNTGKNGRVIPVKVLLFKNGVAISDTSTVLMKVVGSNCEAGSGTDPIDEYADAGASNGNTNLFRWTAPHWTYNLDTRALGLATNACYRLDVYIGSTTGSTAIKASAMRWAIFKPVK
jgi:galactose oxidase-like protein